MLIRAVERGGTRGGGSEVALPLARLRVTIDNAHTQDGMRLQASGASRLGYQSGVSLHDTKN